MNLVMGLNRVKMQPCGFCFVEYATRAEAKVAVDTFNRSVLDGMLIRVDWDYGFEASRQFGRGKQGGQVRDEIKASERGEGALEDADRPVVLHKQERRSYGDGGDRGGWRGRGGGGFRGGGGWRGGGDFPRKRTNRDREIIEGDIRDMPEFN